MAEDTGIGRSDSEIMLDGSVAEVPVTVAAAGLASTGSRLPATGATDPTGAASRGVMSFKTSGVLA